MFNQEQQKLEDLILSILKEHDIPTPEALKWSAIPFSGEWGMATPFFPIAAEEARAGKQVIVPKRAAEIAELVAAGLGQVEGFARIEAVKGYLNIYYDNKEFARRVIDLSIDQDGDYGRGPDKDQRVMVEFSQPNTHKAMHVGHLRNMMLGSALANILEFAGYKVVRANYIGDFGRDVIKWMWNYQSRHDGELPPEDSTRWMGDLYAESTHMLEEHPEEGEKGIQDLFDRWEAQDPEVVGLWKKTRQWSLDGFNKVYELMGIHFDRIYYESEMEKEGKEIVSQLIESGIATDERPEGGPVIVKLDEILGLEKETFRVLIILRSDNTALYATWELALAQKKFEEYDLDKSIYVVDVRQSLHFTQVFKTLEIAGYKNTDKFLHLPYEIVNLPGNVTMKSREGTVVLLEDLIREAIQRAYEVGLERNPDLDEGTRKEVAEMVALGAIKYPMIARDNTKTATFDWESALDFNGHAAPYIQYAYVRTNSLLKKHAHSLPAALTPAHDLEEKEIELIQLISQWPAVVQKSAEEYKTLFITNHAYELAKAFNEFYNSCPVLKAEPAVRDARLRLVAAAQNAIHNALSVLGIPVPEVM